MNKKLLIIFSLVITFIVMLNCNSNSLESAYDQDIDLIPLSIGNMWIYKVSYFIDDTKVNRIQLDTSLIVNNTIIDGEKWYIYNNGSIDKNIKSEYWQHVGNKTLKVFPNKLNDCSDFNGSNYKKLVSKNEKVEYLFEECNTYLYDEIWPNIPRGDTIVTKYYIVPDIGIVKTVKHPTVFTGGEDRKYRKIVKELIELKIN